ncbi:hypothetical protein [Chryseobacterium sp. VD8]|uniref:hypothetical protein n=1 Tax=Chryseobacterium sp. VD8 TaxID=3081254 RepID=UPI0030165E0F
MKFKFILVLLGLFIMLINSCRETEELYSPNAASEEKLNLREDNEKENDSIKEHKDPPIKGTHWKIFGLDKK